MVHQIIQCSSESIQEAVALLRAGELVAFPTETVYGLGADARRDGAVAGIYTAKGRPAGNPVIVHVAGLAEARACAGEWPEVAQKLAERFWPGPLTVIVPRGKGISVSVSAGRETVALRVPAHPVAQALLQSFGGPIAAPSANRSGFTSPTTAAHAMAELGGRVQLILDGGASAVGVESTVVDVTGSVARILRPGAVTAEMLRDAVGEVECISTVVAEKDSAESPGQHSRHYAPRTTAHYFPRERWSEAIAWVAGQGKPVALITHDPGVRLNAPHEVVLMPADGTGYARTLYASLRQTDEMGLSTILILLPDTTEGLWAAVLDRVKRAATPLPSK